MQDIKSLYVLGLPLDTKFGQMHFIKVNQYYDLIKFTPFLDLEKFEVINMFYKLDTNLGDYVKDKEFIYIINNFSDIFDLKSTFQELFTLCFNQDVFSLIQTDEEFNYLKNLIREMNCITKEEKNPNPEIQRYNDMKKLYDQKKNGGISIESIITSVWVSLGCNPFELTIYQLHALFNRISQFKNFDTTILYNSVAGDIPIEHWYKHVDIFNNKKDSSTLENFTDYANSIMTK